MEKLKTILKPGTKLGEGRGSYTVERTTDELIYLRSESNKINENGTLRLIPVIVIKDILNAIFDKKIEANDVLRKRDDGSERLFQSLKLEHDSFILGYDSTIKKICEYCLNNPITPTEKTQQTQLPKPFVLLAGISGTGKSRFVRKQAQMQSAIGDLSYLEQIAVRPDWHEPSDLLGYVSRIGAEHYVATLFLKFIAKAWRDAFASADADGFYTLNPEAKTHWVCLDEMNLAPVEQYFADYLSLIETRQWRDGQYRCDAIFKPSELAFSEGKKTAALNNLANELGFKSEAELVLWAHFLSKGMPIPPNLIVAGTVNMDETTHGFSRKVIDRALTIDFGVFFPNVFSAFLDPKTTNKKINFSSYSDVEGVDLSALKYTAADGAEVRMVDASIALMTEINAVVKGTPFELAYRALNEMLVALACYAPTDEPTLHAVWDDFLMGKLLPRLEGDAEKLRYVDDKNSLLTQLSALLTNRLHSGEGKRPDLLRENKDGTSLRVEYRSLEKLDWMQKRLVRDSFTSFWP